jgi:hypothetical protein
MTFTLYIPLWLYINFILVQFKIYEVRLNVILSNFLHLVPLRPYFFLPTPFQTLPIYFYLLFNQNNTLYQVKYT